VARGLTLDYGGRDGVNGLDLAIPHGCKFGLLGPNGAGKSTTLKLFMGMLRPDAGSLSVLGQDAPARNPELRARIGYVPERHHIYRWMTVGEVVRFVRAFYPTWNDNLCDELLGQYGLAMGKKVEQLSHGMTTKLALVLALSHEPELLILDEPTTGLDPTLRRAFFAI
ncbi:MAG: ABC transporter ATP-binding protein, partial [Planctomycetes bacterium]|nr:ABC transporter ATP-binding protein [Planctomycetota bacterium]